MLNLPVRYTQSSLIGVRSYSCKPQLCPSRLHFFPSLSVYGCLLSSGYSNIKHIPRASVIDDGRKREWGEMRRRMGFGVGDVSLRSWFWYGNPQGYADIFSFFVFATSVWITYEKILVASAISAAAAAASIPRPIALWQRCSKACSWLFHALGSSSISPNVIAFFLKQGCHYTLGNTVYNSLYFLLQNSRKCWMIQVACEAFVLLLITCPTHSISCSCWLLDIWPCIWHKRWP